MNASANTAQPGKIMLVGLGPGSHDHLTVRARAAIAEADSNIVHISMDDTGGMYTTLYFTLQVRDRKHLASVMRNIRHMPEVSKIARIRDSEERPL